MLVYMSSYPRSGNSLMQQIINNYFEKPWTSVDVAKRPLNRIVGTPENFTNWRYRADILELNQSSSRRLIKRLNNRFFKIFNLKDWIAYYDLNVFPYTKNCKYLLPGCLHALTLENRRCLAEDEEYFFVKTHWLPFQTYLPNEYVIQIVRNPLNVFISYLNFLKDFEHIDKSLESVILGQVTYGSWGAWHQGWNSAAQDLGSRFLRLVFEDVVLDKIDACRRIESILSLSYNRAKADISFEQMRQINSKYYRSGAGNTERQEYSENQLSLIDTHHGDVMAQLGYTL